MDAYALTLRESPERACAAHVETPTQHVWHFAAILSFAEHFSLLFLVISFQNSLTLEEPFKVLKVGL